MKVKIEIQSVQGLERALNLGVTLTPLGSGIQTVLYSSLISKTRFKAPECQDFTLALTMEWEVMVTLDNDLISSFRVLCSSFNHFTHLIISLCLPWALLFILFNRE